LSLSSAPPTVSRPSSESLSPGTFTFTSSGNVTTETQTTTFTLSMPLPPPRYPSRVDPGIALAATGAGSLGVAAAVVSLLAGSPAALNGLQTIAVAVTLPCRDRLPLDSSSRGGPAIVASDAGFDALVIPFEIASSRLLGSAIALAAWSIVGTFLNLVVWFWRQKGFWDAAGQMLWGAWMWVGWFGFGRLGLAIVAVRAVVRLIESEPTQPATGADPRLPMEFFASLAALGVALVIFAQLLQPVLAIALSYSTTQRVADVYSATPSVFVGLQSAGGDSDDESDDGDDEDRPHEHDAPPGVQPSPGEPRGKVTWHSHEPALAGEGMRFRVLRSILPAGRWVPPTDADCSTISTTRPQTNTGPSEEAAAEAMQGEAVEEAPSRALFETSWPQRTMWCRFFMTATPSVPTFGATAGMYLAESIWFVILSVAAGGFPSVDRSTETLCVAQHCFIGALLLVSACGIGALRPFRYPVENLSRALCSSLAAAAAFSVAADTTAGDNAAAIFVLMSAVVVLVTAPLVVVGAWWERKQRAKDNVATKVKTATKTESSAAIDLDTDEDDDGLSTRTPSLDGNDSSESTSGFDIAKWRATLFIDGGSDVTPSAGRAIGDEGGDSGWSLGVEKARQARQQRRCEKYRRRSIEVLRAATEWRAADGTLGAPPPLTKRPSTLPDQRELFRELRDRLVAPPAPPPLPDTVPPPPSMALLRAGTMDWAQRDNTPDIEALRTQLLLTAGVSRKPAAPPPLPLNGGRGCFRPPPPPDAAPLLQVPRLLNPLNTGDPQRPPGPPPPGRGPYRPPSTDL
jgi:hypothetical protein